MLSAIRARADVRRAYCGSAQVEEALAACRPAVAGEHPAQECAHAGHLLWLHQVEAAEASRPASRSTRESCGNVNQCTAGKSV